MDSPRYSLQNLAERVGIEPRTIRSYFERGLLRGAERPGPGATYGQYHLDRLLVIRRLREVRDLSLDQIRALLHSLSPAQIQAIAKGGLRVGAIVDTDDFDNGPIRFSVGGLDTESTERTDAATVVSAELDPAAPKTEESIAHEPPLDAIASRLAMFAASRDPTPATQREWLEYEISPDVFLRVRATLGASHLDQFQRIAGYLRDALLGGSVGSSPSARSKP